MPSGPYPSDKSPCVWTPAYDPESEPEEDSASSPLSTTGGSSSSEDSRAAAAPRETSEGVPEEEAEGTLRPPRTGDPAGSRARRVACSSENGCLGREGPAPEDACTPAWPPAAGEGDGGASSAGVPPSSDDENSMGCCVEVAA